MNKMAVSIIMIMIFSGYALPAGADLGNTTSGSDPTTPNLNSYTGSKIQIPNFQPLVPAENLKIVSLAAGARHTCALIEGGGLKCWGNNEEGQLGDGTNTERSMPVPVTGLSSGVVAVTLGCSHTCALTENGAVKCWGDNYSGQLGDRTNEDANTPVNVDEMGSGITAISAGDTHTCALTVKGAVKCWGYNNTGQLGDNSTEDSNRPVSVSGLSSGVTAITTGEEHTCALEESGGVKCWGENYYGQLGTGDEIEYHSPQDVPKLSSGVLSITAGGYHTCAVIEGGGAMCWGNNEYGQLGDETQTDRNEPVEVTGLTSGVTALSAGYEHTCGIVNGGVMCWGNNEYGQLGDGTIDESDIPVAVVGLGGEPGIISAGGFHACARTVAGQVMCWGQNSDGQIGVGYTAEYSTPVLVTGLGGSTTTSSAENVHSSNAVEVSAGSYHTCAAVDGGAMCWGRNYIGQLGNNSTTDSAVPVAVSELGAASGVTQVATGGEHSCALVNGGVKCWGSNLVGQLGDSTGTGSDVPVQVSGLTTGVKAITAGRIHTCAIVTVSTNDVAKCWGGNYWGMLGDSSYDNRKSPVDVSGITGGVTALDAGVGNHTCAVVNGAAKCWGSNGYGQLGDGTKVKSNEPVDVTGMTSGVSDIGLGFFHTLAISTTTGAANSWGSNQRGQLGDGSNENSKTPVNVSGLDSGVSQVTGGMAHSCALAEGGGAKCWGGNYDGQLGDGSKSDRLTPVNVSGLGPGSGINDISAGYTHTCIVDSLGAVKCWGDNNYGQLGNGKTGYETSPLAVDGVGYMLPAEITNLSPGSAIAGGPAFTLTVNGSGFVDGISTMRWNGSDRKTSFVSKTQLTAEISAEDIAAPGTASVTVFKSAYGEATSNVVSFPISVFIGLPVVANSD